MLNLLLMVLLLFGSDAEIAKQNDRSIASARAAVAEMARLAKSPDERALAQEDSKLVEHAARLLKERDAGMRSAASDRTQAASRTKQMQEAQMSFNLQYLQLQSQMQHENRSYTAISNIMKTKHDTVKNSISNIR